MRILMATLTAGIVLAAGTPGRSADKEKALSHFKQGMEFLEEENFEKALSKFKKAYKYDPNYKLLYSIGQAEVGLGRHEDALDTFDRYLSDGGAKIKAKMRKKGLSCISSG